MRRISSQSRESLETRHVNKQVLECAGSGVNHGNCKGVGRGEAGAGFGRELKLERNADPGDELEHGRKDQKQGLKCSPPDTCVSLNCCRVLFAGNIPGVSLHAWPVHKCSYPEGFTG